MSPAQIKDHLRHLTNIMLSQTTTEGTANSSCRSSDWMKTGYNCPNHISQHATRWSDIWRCQKTEIPRPLCSQTSLAVFLEKIRKPNSAKSSAEESFARSLWMDPQKSQTMEYYRGRQAEHGQFRIAAAPFEMRNRRHWARHGSDWKCPKTKHLAAAHDSRSILKCRLPTAFRGLTLTLRGF